MDQSFSAALALVVLLLAGCATRAEAVPPPAQQPAPAKEPAEPPASNTGTSAPTSLEEDEKEGAPLTTIEGAEAEFARVERELDGLWAGAEKPATKAGDDLATRCETSCKAFLSLERAAGAICRIAGDADPRCTRARKTVEKNRLRIAECACE